MSQEFPNVVHALASVTTGGEVPASSYVINNGFASLARNGAGDYSLFLSQPADAAECVATATGRGTGGAALGYAVEHVSDTELRVRNSTTTSETPADADFDIVVHRAAQGVSP